MSLDSSESRLSETLGSATPSAPEGLAERVLIAVRDAALSKLRFRQELERSARGSLIAAAAGLLACAALVLSTGSDTPTTALLSPTGALSGALSGGTPSGSSVASPDSSDATGSASAQGDGELSSEIDDAEALSLSTPPGVLENELSSGLWLFSEDLTQQQAPESTTAQERD